MGKKKSSGFDPLNEAEWLEIRLTVARIKTNYNKRAQEIVSKYNLPDSFFSEISRRDDFTFILAMSAIIETATNEFIDECIQSKKRPKSLLFGGNPISAVLRELPMHGGRSKIALLKVHEVLDDIDFAFIDSLSYIRNRYAHTIKNMGRTALELLEEKPSKRQERLRGLSGLNIHINDMAGIEALLHDLIYIRTLSIAGKLFSAALPEVPEFEGWSKAGGMGGILFPRIRERLRSVSNGDVEASAASSSTKAIDPS